MQLTKDDVKRRPKDNIESKEYGNIECISFSKFQQVVEFYEKYKANPWDLETDHPELVNKWLEVCYDKPAIDSRKEINDLDYFFYEQIHDEDGDDFTDWLFNYCFKDGLK